MKELSLNMFVWRLFTKINDFVLGGFINIYSLIRHTEPFMVKPVVLKKKPI